jgi:hypothetical protein
VAGDPERPLTHALVPSLEAALEAAYGTSNGHDRETERPNDAEALAAAERASSCKRGLPLPPTGLSALLNNDTALAGIRPGGNLGGGNGENPYYPTRSV